MEKGKASPKGREMTLEERANNLEIDRELLWECIWGFEKNLIKIYNLLHEEIFEVGALLYKHERADKTFKDQLSVTHHNYYVRFEEVFKSLKEIRANAFKQRAFDKEDSL